VRKDEGKQKFNLSKEVSYNNLLINTHNWMVRGEEFLSFLRISGKDTAHMDMLMTNQVLTFLLLLLVRKRGKDSLVQMKPTNKLYYSSLQSEPQIQS